MLYAYYKLKTRFRSVKELMEFVEENLVRVTTPYGVKRYWVWGE